MKKVSFLLMAMVLTIGVFAQNENKKPLSPPASASNTTSSGVTISISYSQPSVRGRTIGKDLEPKDGQVWRAGANKTTSFEVNKDVTIDGKALTAGKYGLFVLTNNDTWTFIFSKKWDHWGTEYSESDDALRVPVKAEKAAKFTETLTYLINTDGKVSLLWGSNEASFTVK